MPERRGSNIKNHHSFFNHPHARNSQQCISSNPQVRCSHAAARQSPSCETPSARDLPDICPVVRHSQPSQRNLGHVASPSILAGIAQQLPVFREIMDVMVFDSYIVDEGHFSQGILMFNITTPPNGTPSKTEGEFARAAAACCVRSLLRLALLVDAGDAAVFFHGFQQGPEIGELHVWVDVLVRHNFLFYDVCINVKIRRKDKLILDAKTNFFIFLVIHIQSE